MHLLDHSRLPGFYFACGWIAAVPDNNAFLIKSLWETAGGDLHTAEGPTADLVRRSLKSQEAHAQGAVLGMVAALTVSFMMDTLH
jgi:hypothetical protein